MNQKQMLSRRLFNQQLAWQNFTHPADLVSWMGAVQSQDYAMAKWAIGLRLKGSTDDIIEEAVNKAEIIRTHVLRPTWHFVSAQDIRWMLKLSAPQILKLMVYYDRLYKIDPKEITRTLKLLEKTLSGNQHLTRPELAEVFSKSKIICDGLRLGHLLIHAEMRGIICSGIKKGNQQTYALLEERIKPEKEKSREESLGLLAQKYFQSHGPATVKDFAWWCGLNMKDSNLAIETLADKLIKVTVNEDAFFFIESNCAEKINDQIYLLPNYDEYTVAYTRRDDIIQNKGSFEKLSRGGNPLFSNNVLIKGKVAGLWKRTIKKDRLSVTFDLFDNVTSAQQKLLLKEVQRYEKFLGLE